MGACIVRRRSAGNMLFVLPEDFPLLGDGDWAMVVAPEFTKVSEDSTVEAAGIKYRICKDFSLKVREKKAPPCDLEKGEEVYIVGRSHEEGGVLVHGQFVRVHPSGRIVVEVGHGLLAVSQKPGQWYKDLGDAQAAMGVQKEEPHEGYHPE